MESPSLILIQDIAAMLPHSACRSHPGRATRLVSYDRLWAEIQAKRGHSLTGSSPSKRQGRYVRLPTEFVQRAFRIGINIGLVLMLGSLDGSSAHSIAKVRVGPFPPPLAMDNEHPKSQIPHPWKSVLSPNLAGDWMPRTKWFHASCRVSLLLTRLYAAAQNTYTRLPVSASRVGSRVPGPRRLFASPHSPMPV